MKELKEQLINRIKAHFPDITVENNFNYNRFDVSINKESIHSILFYLKDVMGFKHLSDTNCVDWLEEGEFEIVFIVWSPAEKIKIFVRTRIDRNNPVLETLDMIWPQLHTYEREFREMFGIQFTGLEAPDEFILEDWQGPPPYRRDFDTAAFAAETFFERPGREDAEDVREAITKLTGEEIPEFAKKYSR
ncbi:MAG: NADH-quinone oxidoreductase subunit C [Bacteroidales bacterium]|nr:NADH-quinone oxidoreductase subunit C [Bacteroidales bacterium]